MESKKEKSYWWIWPLVILIIVVGVVIYLVSLGSAKVSSNDLLPKEFTDSKKDVLKLHAALNLKLETKILLKDKLAKRFTRVYTVVRIVLIAVWITPLYFLYRFGMITNLGDALNYTEVLLLGLLTTNFITFGSLANLTEFISLVKARVENWVWGKNITLEGEIDLIGKELKSISISMEASQIINKTNGHS